MVIVEHMLMRNTNLYPKTVGGTISITVPTAASVLLGNPPQAEVLPKDLLMQTVVTPHGKTDDGSIIRIVTAPWLSIIDALLKDPDLANNVDPRQLEELVAGGWDRAGASEVILTPRSGDLGRDVIATFKGIGTFRNIGTLRFIDQVKRYSPENLVTAEHARALLLVLDAEKASKAFLTTTSDFAPKLHEDRLLKPYIGTRLELVNRGKLLEWFKELAKS